MAMITIGGVGLADPSELKVLQSDIDSQDSSRNEIGVLQRDRVRQGVYKLEVSWALLVGAAVETIKTAIAPSSFSVVFPTSAGNVTKTMYASDRSIEMVTTQTGTRWNVSFSLIEF